MTYHEKLNESLSKGLNHMIDLHIKFVCSKERSPSGKDRMCNLENADVDLGVSSGKPTDEFLHQKMSVHYTVIAHQYCKLTWVRVSHRRQKSESAMTLIASPSWA